MQQNWVKYFLLFLLTAAYLNRGLFVTNPEGESFYVNEKGVSGSSEINSLIELILGSNGIDEDGDSSESYNLAKVIQPLSFHIFAQSLEFQHNLYKPLQEQLIPVTEAILPLNVYSQIDPPPKG